MEVILSNRIDKLRNTSTDIMKKKSILDTTNKSLDSDLDIVKEILGDTLSDTSDIDSIEQHSSVLQSEQSRASSELDDVNSQREDTIAEINSYKSGLESNVDKLEQMNQVSDLVSTDMQQSDTRKRIEELAALKELLEDESDTTSTTTEMSRMESPLSLQDHVNDLIFGADSAYDAERYQAAGIAGVFNAIPRERREAVYSSFENAPEIIKKITQELSDKLNVGNTQNDERSHYNPISKQIRMDAIYNNDDYAEAFCHEYGHFADNMKGNISQTLDFKDAICEDLKAYDKSTAKGILNFKCMVENLINSEAINEMTVSDCLSAFFCNDLDIIQKYQDEKTVYYFHDNNYWSTYGNRESEIFANFFSMTAQNLEDSCNFIKNHFPSTYNMFSKSLREEV